MLQLTLEEVKKNAREYYEKGLLTAQHPQANLRKCVNYLPDHPHRCAIAASYPEWFCKAYKATGLCCLVHVSKVVTFPSEEEYRAAAKIQVTHDAWASNSNASEDFFWTDKPESIESYKTNAEVAHQELLKLIAA